MILINSRIDHPKSIFAIWIKIINSLIDCLHGDLLWSSICSYRLPPPPPSQAASSKERYISARSLSFDFNPHEIRLNPNLLIGDDNLFGWNVSLLTAITIRLIEVFKDDVFINIIWLFRGRGMEKVFESRRAFFQFIVLQV